MIHVRPISRLSNHFSVRELGLKLPQRFLSTSNPVNVRESENFTFDWNKVRNKTQYSKAPTEFILSLML